MARLRSIGNAAKHQAKKPVNIARKQGVRFAGALIEMHKIVLPAITFFIDFNRVDRDARFAIIRAACQTIIPPQSCPHNIALS